jgi:hypothetical protein
MTAFLIKPESLRTLDQRALLGIYNSYVNLDENFQYTRRQDRSTFRRLRKYCFLLLDAKSRRALNVREVIQ